MAGTPPVLTKKFQAALSKALGASEPTPLVHVSIDRDKTGGHVFAALGLGQAHDLGKRSLDEFHHLIGHLRKQGWKLIVVQESCGFGYELHRTLAAMPGVEALIVHCQPLSGKRSRGPWHGAETDSRRLPRRGEAAVRRLLSQRRPHGRTPALPASATIQQRQP